MKRTGAVAVSAVAVLACLSGCSAVLGGTTATPATAASAAPGPGLSMNPVPPAVPKPMTAPPALKTTGTAWPAILASLSGYGQWILANADPTQVGTVAEPGCAMSDLLSQQATSLFQEQAYVSKATPPVFSSVTGPVAGSVIGNEVTLDVTATRAAATVVSRSKGAVITPYPALPTTNLEITLIQGADKKWRFCTVQAQTDEGSPDDPSVALL